MIEVWFSKSTNSMPDGREKRFPSDIVILSPDDEWNDFGMQTVFAFRYVSEKGADISGTLKLGIFKTSESPHKVVMQSLSDGPISARSLKLEFFTLQQNMQAYRDIVSKLSPKIARDFLLEINDLVAHGALRASRKLAERAEETKIFHASLVRSSEAHYAYHNAASILDGLESEIVRNAPKSFELKFEAPALGTAIELEFSFLPESVLSSRIAVLIGKNGTGKSLTLFNVAESLLKGDKRVTSSGKRAQFNRLIAVSTSHETHRTFPKRSRWAKIDYKVIRSANVHDRSNRLTSLVAQLIRSEDSIAQLSRLQIFLRSIDGIASVDQIGIPVINKNERGIQALRNHSYLPLSSFVGQGEQRQIELFSILHPTANPAFLKDNQPYPFSSGQISFLRLAAAISLNVENGSLLLIDEPETHLHPKMITTMFGLLNGILENTGSVCLIATHSAYLVRETPRDQVYVFHIMNKEVVVSNPTLKTLGSNVGEISFDVFGDQDFGYLVEQLRGQLTAGPADQELISLASLQKDLPSDAITYLQSQPDINLEVE